MKRREVLQVGAGTALAHGLVTSLGCGAQSNRDEGENMSGHEHHAGGEAAAAPTSDALGLHAAASRCIEAGEACLSHCLRSLSTGDTMMAECAREVHQMLAVCKAIGALATNGSPHLPALAAVCRDVCISCRAACAPHVDHHRECAACHAACAGVIEASAAVAG